MLALYAARLTKPVQAASEPVHTMAARPVGADWRRWGSAARTSRAVPTTLMSKMWCHSSSVTSSTPPVEPMPALETTTSRPLSRSVTSASDVGGEVHPADHRDHQIVVCGRCQQPLALVCTGDRLHEHRGSYRPPPDPATYRIVQVL